MEIIIKAVAGSVTTDDGKFTGDMSELHGVDCQDCFSDYFDGDESDRYDKIIFYILKI